MLGRERRSDSRRRYESERDKDRAEMVAGHLLICERDRKLLGRDYPVLDEDFAERRPQRLQGAGLIELRHNSLAARERLASRPHFSDSSSHCPSPREIPLIIGRKRELHDQFR
jgi:hypothetical protein